ncbi:hypothetical protein LMIV_1507 [Listeria monocytogenes FSL J1-208]|nr:hypothetical protein LMIV_1507 [Listeria monocytogenes FSL J1-208]
MWLTDKLTDEINNNQVQFLFNHEIKKWSKEKKTTFRRVLVILLTFFSLKVNKITL